MSYNFIKKNKSTLNYFIIILIVATVFNYIFQISYVDKIYTVNLSLKKIDTFNIDKDFYNMKGDKEELLQQAGKTLEKYERSLQIRMQEKVNFEINYDQNLIEISKICTKLKILIKGKYYFINCNTTNAEKDTKAIIQNLSNVLEKTVNNLELDLIKVILFEMGVKQNQITNDKFQVIDNNVFYTRNIIKNIILLNVIFIFAFIIYLFNFKKIRKTFF